MTIMFQISTFLFFIVPMTAIIILYMLIAINLRTSALNRANSEESTGGHHSSHSRRVVRMLGEFLSKPLNTNVPYSLVHFKSLASEIEFLEVCFNFYNIFNNKGLRNYKENLEESTLFWGYKVSNLTFLLLNYWLKFNCLSV
jgi:hypothetical protein